MDAAFGNINYYFRPAKHVERKMLVEALQRLRPFGSVESYRYVGFGSYYYRDFALLHKALGISNMLSVEHENDAENQKRFKFNLPYSCVTVIFGESNAVLPTLPWDVRTILWLDYDGGLDNSVLSDVGHFCANACVGSVVLVTLNAHPVRRDKTPLDTLKSQVGASNVPLDLTNESFREWGKAAVYRRILVSVIEESLRNRNGTRHAGTKWLFRQLFNFHYRDNAMMLTVGGLLYDEGQAHLLGSCSFDALSFVRSGEEPYRIQVPLLTYREIRHLDQQLPGVEGVSLNAPGVPGDDITNYRSIYRWFPNFTEAEIL